jgi:hypothetical protein
VSAKTAAAEKAKMAMHIIAINFLFIYSTFQVIQHLTLRTEKVDDPNGAVRHHQALNSRDSILKKRENVLLLDLFKPFRFLF